LGQKLEFKCYSKESKQLALRKINQLKQHALNLRRKEQPPEIELNDPSNLIGKKNEFYIRYTECADVGHFWGSLDEDDTNETLKLLSRKLNDSSHRYKRLNKEDLFIGQLVTTGFIEEDLDFVFYRAQIIDFIENGVIIKFVDFGNTQKKDYILLFDMAEDLKKIPFQAIEFKLIKMRPNPIKSTVKELNQKDIEDFKNILANCQVLKAKVYSIVKNVVRISLTDETNRFYFRDITTICNKHEISQSCDEPEASISNHEERTKTDYVYINDKLNQNATMTCNSIIKIDELREILSHLKYSDDDNDWIEFKNSPMSPLEISVESLTLCTRKDLIKIDKDSVNYVILDDEYEVKCSNLLVAYDVNINTTNTIRLRNTTLFPKIKGLVSLCLLTFSPFVELR
jgi:hypothetical protein